MPNERPCILVVDDHVEDREQACSILGMFNYEGLPATTPEEAISLAAKHGVDAMLVNIDMAGGGFALSQRLRELPQLARVPLAFSTRQEYDWAQLMEAQFYDGMFILREPYVESELLAQVSAMVRVKRLQDELQARMDELDHLASTDPLTGLYNRRFFFQRMEEEIARANRASSPLCLAYLDIDYFKQINDTHGHLAGDMVLQQISRIMTKLLRRSDVLGRIGGEEFLILLPDTGGAGGQRIAERLRKRVEASMFEHAGVEIPVTVSIGVFFAEQPEVIGVDTLVAKADEALYTAKESGRNRVVYGELAAEAASLS